MAEAGRPKVKDDFYLAAVWNLVSRQIYNNRLMRTMNYVFTPPQLETDKQIPARDISKACRYIFEKHGKVVFELPHKFADGLRMVEHRIQDHKTLRLDYQAAEKLRHDQINHQILHKKTKLMAKRLYIVNEQLQADQAITEAIQSENKRGRGRPPKAR